jgi:hypothetical protein
VETHHPFVGEVTNIGCPILPRGCSCLPRV